MQTFKDNEGQSWTLCLTLGRVRTMREKLGLDLLNPQHYLQVLNSLTDRLAFVFLLVEDQAKTLDVTVDEFEERLYGETFATEAGNAFLSETRLFFQKLGQKAMMGLAERAIESMKTNQAMLDEMIADGRFDSLLSEAQEEMQQLLRPIVGAGSQDSEQSQESALGI